MLNDNGIFYETGIRMLFAFIKSIPLFSCGKEEEGPIPTDRQVPIGVMEASLSTRVSTRGVINTGDYKLGISVRTLRDIHLSMMLPIVTTV